MGCLDGISFLRGAWRVLTLPLFLILLLPGAMPGRAERRAPRRPNVLFIIADQWRAQAFGYAGDPNVKTPHLDALERESIHLTQATSTVPVCCPTRASLLTGQRALTHGVFMNDVPLDPSAATMGKVFAAAGYDTGFIGKWHVDGHGRSAFIPRERRQGFDYWKALECTHNYNQSLFWADAPPRRTWDGYDAQVQTRDAQEYVRSRAGSGKPFLLYLSWGPPHEPYQTAPERYRSLYDPARVVLRPNVPEAARAQARTDLAGYYAHCTALDDCMNDLRLTLKAAGIEKDTLLVFTADHGDMLGSHGSQKKQQPYEESARVPFLIHHPRAFGRGRRLQAPFGTEDALPTLLRLCRLPVPGTVQGRDYSSYLHGGKDPSGGSALISCPAPFGQWRRAVGGREYRALRTDRYTYARGLHGPWLLYDNRRDPYQMRNLVEDPAHARLLARLDGRLHARLRENGDDFRPAAVYSRGWTDGCKPGCARTATTSGRRPSTSDAGGTP